jgi:hypothetical protein
MDLDGDIAIAQTGTRSQTQLARSLDPGPKPDRKNSYRFLSLLAFAVLFGAAADLIDVHYGTSSDSSTAWSLAVFGVALAGMALLQWDSGYKKSDALINLWESKRRMFERGWVCHQCGNTWEPDRA